MTAPLSWTPTSGCWLTAFSGATRLQPQLATSGSWMCVSHAPSRPLSCYTAACMYPVTKRVMDPLLKWYAAQPHSHKFFTPPQLPPMMRRQQTAGTAAVGAAALLQLRDEAELLRSVLAFCEEGDTQPEEDAAAEFAAAKASRTLPLVKTRYH